MHPKILSAAKQQLSLQFPEGYWWYTLEATEYIAAEAIFLMYFMGMVDTKTASGLTKRILSCRREDGSWSLYHGGPPDLSTTIECYWALKLVLSEHECLAKSRDFILSAGGITRSRVFTKIHLAMFGLVPWNACPVMPAELMLMPAWSPVNIYEFSSWARACIVPLLVILEKKPQRKLPNDFNLDELFAEPPAERNWSYETEKSFLSWERFFIELNKLLKISSRLPFRPLKGTAMERCEEWICEHINKTEDIYPALAYGAMALSCLSHPNSHPVIQKSLRALESFRQSYSGKILPAVPSKKGADDVIHQQCCISPVWDTPWQITALLDAGISPDDEQLLKAGRWLIKKQITETYGDWKIKNPNVLPGGWSFEFENEYFPDVDDTIQILHVLKRLALPEAEKAGAISRGLGWFVSMQNDDGGWGAFDHNQKFEIVNKIPFSDHGACLDPSSPDITARAITLLAEFQGAESQISKFKSQIGRGLEYLKKTQEPFGAWSGRWGVNYIYGTWCVLTALSKCAGHEALSQIEKTCDWLASIQLEDGGFSESPETYKLGRYAPYPNVNGVPSQTAWALMGMIAANKIIRSEKIKACIGHSEKFLLDSLKDDGTWDEPQFTGTGFPGHFYIRYHGYRHYFPLLALAQAK